MRRAAFFLLPLLLWVGCSPDRSQLAAGETKELQLDRSTAEFFAGPIVRFDIKLPPESLRSLQENGRKAVPATVVVGTNVFDGVSVHVKGAAGSTRSIDDNPALTLNFGKPKGGKACFGLRKLHLNNSVQDPSRMDELIAGVDDLSVSDFQPNGSRHFIVVEHADAANGGRWQNAAAIGFVVE